MIEIGTAKRVLDIECAIHQYGERLDYDADGPSLDQCVRVVVAQLGVYPAEVEAVLAATEADEF